MRQQFGIKKGISFSSTGSCRVETKPHGGNGFTLGEQDAWVSFPELWGFFLKFSEERKRETGGW